MSKDEFIALHGEEAFELFGRHKLYIAEVYETGTDPLQKVHDELIMPFLLLLGMDAPSGIVEAKKAIKELGDAYIFREIHGGHLEFDGQPWPDFPPIESVVPKVSADDDPLNKPANPTG